MADLLSGPCRDVILNVAIDNEPAQRLYRRYGFVGIGVRRGYYQPSGADALVMRHVIARGRSAGPGGQCTAGREREPELRGRAEFP